MWFAVLYKQDGKMRVTRETVTASKPKNKTSHKPKKTAQQIVEIQSRRETDSDENRTDTQDVSTL